jgi:hypothetical protein
MDSSPGTNPATAILSKIRCQMRRCETGDSDCRSWLADHRPAAHQPATASSQHVKNNCEFILEPMKEPPAF